MLRTATQFGKTLPIAAALVVCATVSPASAQVTGVNDWLERGYFNFNVGFETTSGTLTDSATFPLYGENGTKIVEQNVDSGAFWDFSIGSRVWRNVSAGIGYHRGGNTSEASAALSVPHPQRFNANRQATVAAGELDRTEQAFHIQIGYMIPLSEQLSVHVTGGPSFFNLSQDVLTDATFTEAAPFNTVAASPVVSERTDSAVGVNVGVDVTYKLWESDAYKLGGGVFLRYAGASARITVIENEVDSDVGGLQFGFGARLRF